MVMAVQGLVEHITKRSEALGRDAVFEKSSRISKLPVFLCVQFVRFWWNQQKQVKAKIARVRRSAEGMWSGVLGGGEEGYESVKRSQHECSPSSFQCGWT